MKDAMEAFVTAVNPFTQQQIGAVPSTAVSLLPQILARAREAQGLWANTGLRQRQKVFRELRSHLVENMRSIVDVVSLSTSKPYVESLSAEVFGALEMLRWCHNHAPRHLRKQYLWMGRYWFMGRQSTVQRKPLGVIGIISPWNFPFGIPVAQVLQAVMAGNAVVLKVSEYTPLVGLKIQEICAAAFPKDLVQVVFGGPELGHALIGSGVEKIIFTGSTRTGCLIAAEAAKHCIPTALELGGKDAMVVLADAHIERAVRGALWGAFSNSGQVCASVERLYVHESIREKFVSLLKTKLAMLKQGPPQSYADVGTVINTAQRTKVLGALEQARKDGAVLTQATPASGYVVPTILENVTDTMPAVTEETFGPALPILTFTSDDEVVQRVNANSYGLSASVWSENLRHARRTAEKLEVGSVTVNGSAYAHALPMTPWFGIKKSGWGVGHGKWGLEEVTRLHHIHTNLARGNHREFWWFGYTQTMFENLVDLAVNFTRIGRFTWLPALFPFLALNREKKY
jgi:succinate-semialdehyde dehydrogenase/glutarate-semialdehyde dehydrogenase